MDSELYKVITVLTAGGLLLYIVATGRVYAGIGAPIATREKTPKLYWTLTVMVAAFFGFAVKRLFDL